MILFEITQREDHPVYQDLAIENVNRQYDFLKSAVKATLGIKREGIGFLNGGGEPVGLSYTKPLQ